MVKPNFEIDPDQVTSFGEMTTGAMMRLRVHLRIHYVGAYFKEGGFAIEMVRANKRLVATGTSLEEAMLGGFLCLNQALPPSHRRVALA